MTKYIVKNCPSYGVTTPTSCALTSDDSCEFTDCPIKQIVDECKKYSYIFSERGILASLILQILQVEEVEE